MNRPEVYTAEIVRAEDVVWGWRDTLEAIANAVADIVGGNSLALFSGLAASATSPLSMSINIAIGDGYQFIVVDPTQNGPLPPSTDTAFVQGINASQTTLVLSTAGLSSGQSMWALIEAQVQFVDIVRANDPSGGVLQFFNPANPSQPLQGPGGSGGSLPTERTAVVTFQIKYGVPATTGSEVPPNADSGWTGLYLIDLSFGQTQVQQSQIKVAGPNAGTGVPGNYPLAPFLAGLLNSHHGGVSGQAPQIQLTAEVQGVLPLANLPASNTIGTLPVIRLGSGSPSGTQAGNIDDLWFDTSGNNLYVCKSSGTSATAVWSVAVTVAGATPTGAAGGDLAGSYPNPSVARINGTSVPTTPSAGQVLTASSSSAAGWVTPLAVQAQPGAQNLRISNDGTLPLTTLDCTFDYGIIATRSGQFPVLAVIGFAGSCLVVGSQTGSIAGKRDQTTAFGANTFFHLYIIGGGGQSPAMLASLSYGSPTLPSLYTSWAYLGTWRTDGSGNCMSMVIQGNLVSYLAQQTVLNGGGQTVPTAISLSSVVPSQAQKIIIAWQSTANALSNSNGANVIVHIQVASGVDFDTFIYRVQIPGFGNVYSGAYKSEVPNVNQQVYYFWDNNGVGGIGGQVVSAWVQGYKVPNGST